ncbi:hypothetical protein BH09MYX1_BH09MYX1_09930 [soil metagenome]
MTMNGKRLRKLATAGLAGTVVLALASACNVGDGQGSATGTLNVTDCWSGKFDLQPDFFGATPFGDTLQFRIQRGSDLMNFSDGLSLLVTDAARVRSDLLGKPLGVALPAEVSPPGVPVKATADPALVQFSLYLQRSCRPEVPALYAVTEATTNADGSCDAATVALAKDCSATTTTKKSTITFQHLFNGIPEEPDADKRLSEATFDVYLADPRETCPGGLGPPPPCRGHITGAFRFYFTRGRPAQAFP